MSGRARAACLPLNYEDLTRLSGLLAADELGFAVRMVAYHAQLGTGVPDEMVPTYLGIKPSRWEKVKVSLKQVFDLREGRWVMPEIVERLEAAAATPPAPAQPPAPVAESLPVAAVTVPAVVPRKAARARAGELPLVYAPAPGPRATLQPLPPAAEEPQSLRSAAFKIGVALMTNTGRTEATARTLIGSLLRDYDFGYVAAAIQDAWKLRDDIAEPYAWIRKRLQRYPSKAVENKQVDAVLGARAPKAPAVPRPIATPDFLGISPAMAARIRKNNKEKPTFSYVDEVGKGTTP